MPGSCKVLLQHQGKRRIVAACGFEPGDAFEVALEEKKRDFRRALSLFKERPSVVRGSSGLPGAPIGGGASPAVAVCNQRAEERLQRIADGIERREAVHTGFLEKASKILLNAYTPTASPPAAPAESPQPDPFLTFSVICRSDLDKIRRTAG